MKTDNINVGVIMEDVSGNYTSKEVDMIRISSDDVLLQSMGKKPELKRVYGFWTLIAYQIMMSASWSCLVVLYSTIMDVGGPAALTWGTIPVAVGQTILMLSLAEYTTIWPTAGGQQYYTQRLANRKWAPFLSYVVGWAVLIGEISTSAGCAANSALIIQAFVEVTHPDYAWHSWMTWLIYSAWLCIPFAINLRHQWMPISSLIGAFWVIGGGIAWAVAFGIMAPKHDTTFIFKTFFNNTGYSSSGWVFIMSFYNPLYGLYGTDGVMHLVEEMRDASRQAPRVMVWGMVFCAITSWFTALLMLWCAADWETYVTATQPYLNWFMDVTNSVVGGGTFCAVLMMGINIWVIVGNNSASCRLAWSMARDGALPYSPYFSNVSKSMGIPFRALGAVLGVELLLGFILLGSDLAFQSILSGAGICFAVGYIVPVLIVIIRGRKVLPPHPNFDLGVLGYPLNVISVLWGLLTIVMYVSPLYVPVTSATIDYMNWSIVIIGATILFVGIWWVLRARKTYTIASNSDSDVEPVDGVHGHSAGNECASKT